MAETLGELDIVIRGRLDQLDRDMSSARSKATGAVDGIADHSERRMGGVFKSIAGMGAALAGTFAAIGIGKVLGGAVEEAQEAAKTAAQTAAVIKSTGSAANVTAKEVDRLATSLSNKTGIDDEAIAAGQNMLLTFTKIRNETGRGNDIFNQASKAALDMSVAMGTDMTQAAMQVGKALNDPVKGMTALGRAGIQFTQQQKDQVKAMVAAGDTLGAQKVILKELETQFGGSAAAQATGLDKARVAWGNFLEGLGTAIAPVIEFGARLLPSILDRITGFAQKLKPVADAVKQVFMIFAKRDFIGGPFAEDSGFIANVFKVRDAITTFIGAAKQVFMIFAKRDFIGGPFAEDSPFIAKVFKVRDVLVATFAAVATFVRNNFVPVLAAVAVVLTAMVIPSVIATATAIAALFSPVVLIVAGIAILVGALVWAYQHFEGFRTVVDAVIRTVVSIIEGGISIIVGIFNVFAGLLTGDWSRLWDGIQSILSGAWAIIKAVVGLAWDGLLALVKAGAGWILDEIKSIPGRILSALGDLGSLLWDAGKKLIGGFIDGIKSMFGAVGSALGSLTSKLTSWKGPPAKDARILYGAGRLVIGGFTAGLRSGFGEVRSTLGTLSSSLSTEMHSTVTGGDGGAVGGRTIIVQGSVVAERQLLDLARGGIDSVGRHNVSTGVKGRRR